MATLCDFYVCNDCECNFYYPVTMGNDNATEDNTVYCPRCFRDYCNKVGE